MEREREINAEFRPSHSRVKPSLGERTGGTDDDGNDCYDSRNDSGSSNGGRFKSPWVSCPG